MRRASLLLLVLLVTAGLGVQSLASASADSSAPAGVVGPLSTDGAKIVDASGHTVVLQGVNWFGFETSNHVVHGLWTRDYRDMLAQIRRSGFNAIRLPFSLQALRSKTITGVDFSNGKNAALRGATPLEAMDVIVKQAAKDHLMVLLDNHSGPDNGYTEPLWYGQGYSEDDWVAAWKLLAQRYAGQPNVIGADLKNEPHGDATWGTGGATDWRRAAERAGNAILSVNPHMLIVVEGIEGSVPGGTLQGSWWGGNLQGVAKWPVRLSRPNRVVYSPHEYGPGVSQQPWFQVANVAGALAARWQQGFGYITKQGIAPVLVGEFGGREVGRDTVEGRWQRQFLDYLSRSGDSWTYWSWNPDSGDTGGVLNDDWTTVDQPKLALLQDAIAHRSITFAAGAAAKATPMRPAPSAPRAPVAKPVPAPAAPSKPSGAVAGSLAATIAVESRWDGGWCGHLDVTGSDGGLGSAAASFTLPSGTSITQQWNGDFSATSGRVRVTFPSWARTSGGHYASTGFCVSGGGAPPSVSAG